MSNGVKIAVGAFVGLLLIGVVLVSSLIGVYNDFNASEKMIQAQYSQNQNNYDNMFKKFKESAQVNEMYSNDLKKIFDSSIKARYGSDGSKAVFQFLKEHNPNLDPSTYNKLQAMIEAGRNSFEGQQKMLLDKKQIYQTNLTSFPNVVIAGVFGFPKIDLAKYDIVTSDETNDAFQTKKASTIQLRDNSK